MLEENEQELDETKTSLNSFNNSLTTTQGELSNLKDQMAEIVINSQQELDETKTSLNSFNNSLTTTQEELTNLKELAAATKSTIFYSFLFYGW